MSINSNKSRTKGIKNPSLAEIENEDDVTPVSDAPTFTLDDLTTKSPDEITAEEQDFLADNAEDLTDEQKVQYGLMSPEDLDPEEKKPAEDQDPEPKKSKPVLDEEGKDEESDADKDKKYKAQQTEAQIQAEKSRALREKAEEAAKITDPTTDELKKFVAEDGANWDELTNFEQAMAKRTYISEKRSNLVLEAVQEGKKVDEWAAKVDDFIDSTDGKPEYLELSSHEGDFRKFAMKEAHRGTPIEVLLPAFLHNLPPTAPKKGSLFEKGGGGERQVQKDGLQDAEQAAKLRTSDPREYRRLVKAGKIKLEI